MSLNSVSETQQVKRKRKYQKRSWVWKFMIEKDDDICICSICGDTVKHDNSTVLIRKLD